MSDVILDIICLCVLPVVIIAIPMSLKAQQKIFDEITREVDRE